MVDVVAAADICVCGHHPHRQFPEGSCHCGCTIYEPDLRREPSTPQRPLRVGTKYQWLMDVGEIL